MDLPLLRTIVPVLVLVPGLAMAVEPAAPAPVDPLGTESLLRLTGALVLVVVLVFGAAWALRRFGQFAGTGHGGLKVVAGIALGQKERVVVLQVGQEQLLLGVAPGRIQTLHRLAEPLAEAARPEPGSSFARQLERLRATASKS